MATTALPKIGTQEEWLAASRELVAKEKELTRLSDELAKKRRELPMVEVTKDYTFYGPDGEKLSLNDLFHNRRQLIVYHFMFGPEEERGCSGCSFLADHFTMQQITHLAQRDTSFVVISRGQIEKLQAYKEKMGWKFPWVSSYGTTFNVDFKVAVDEKIAPPMYNFQDKATLEKKGWKDFDGGKNTEGPGTSCFIKGEDGKIYHTYSCFARGGEAVLSVYKWLDMTALGRLEGPELKNAEMDFKRSNEYEGEVLKHCVRV